MQGPVQHTVGAGGRGAEAIKLLHALLVIGAKTRPAPPLNRYPFSEQRRRTPRPPPQHLVSSIHDLSGQDTRVEGFSCPQTLSVLNNVANQTVALGYGYYFPLSLEVTTEKTNMEGKKTSHHYLVNIISVRICPKT